MTPADYVIGSTHFLDVDYERPLSIDNTSEDVILLCNEFYGEFMEKNNFFGIYEPQDRNEIIEIIQHFCIWLFKNEYTKSKLSLAS